MGRRQFLVTAGAASTLGLASRRIPRVFNPGSQTGIAAASERSGAVDMKGVFSKRYSHLLSPIKIGNVVLKNRMINTLGLPHFFQGPETFPTDQVISHYSGIARNGAAIVTVWEASLTPLNDGTLESRKGIDGDRAHTYMWDAADAGVQNYFNQLTDAIHFYGSKASIAIRISPPEGYGISVAAGGGHGPRDGPDGMPGGERPDGNTGGEGGALGGGPDGNAPDTTSNIPPIMGGRASGKEEIPIELIEKMIEDYANRAKFYQSLGFDAVNIHMSYNSDILAHSLSTNLNKRTDKYGGSVENRARLPLEMFQAFKRVCGQDFLVVGHISGEGTGDGYTLQDTVQFAKTWEGSLDILKFRAKEQGFCHPTGFNLEEDKPLTLRYAQAVKEGGSKMITAPTGGFQELDLLEDYIASGKTDMVAMSRAWIADPEYGQKAYEGRGEDVVPCVLCNACHGVSSRTGPWINFCTVNPKLGIAHKVERMVNVPTLSRKVAVIGGGPGGMKAAIVSAERGHKVTLYEKNDFLGGQLKHTDFASFKWPFRKFKDYLIRQAYKSGVEVLLNTRATPDMIKAKGYDVVLVAIGADPVVPDIPGANGKNVIAPIYVFGNETLGKNVAVIGGKQIGTETGIYLAQKGHKVTVLAEEKSLATDANEIHFIGTLRDAYQSLDTFSFITEVTATRISEGKVFYRDATGAEKSVRADSVVISVGRKPRQDEALKFYDSADRFFTIGDCLAEGDVRISIRSAFSVASQI